LAGEDQPRNEFLRLVRRCKIRLSGWDRAPMEVGRRWVGLVLAGLLVSFPGLARTSERSELLVAKAQVAYHTGRYGEAHGYLEQAVAADPEDDEAYYQLGLVLEKLGRWDEAATAFARAAALERARRTREQAEGVPTPVPEFEKVAPIDEVTRARRPELFKRWDVRASTGVEYDSNVRLAPGSVSDRDDVGIILSAGGRYDLLSRANALFRVEYDMYQVWHPNIRELDFQSQRPRGTASYGFRPNLWAGVQGGYDYFRLGDESYLGEPFVLPFISYLHGGRGLTQITFRWGDGTYFSPPFEDLRDGTTMNVGATHTFYWPGAKYLTLGYEYGREDPSPRFVRGPVTATGPSFCRADGSSSATLPCPRDFENFYNQVSIAAGFQAWWKTTVDVMYVYRYYEYTEANSVAGFRKRRYDNENQFFVQVMRPINANVRVAVAYLGTVNPSNLDLYDYDRNVVSGTVQVVY
jgi:tetratricopeptide (TPR) repeat protein